MDVSFKEGEKIPGMTLLDRIALASMQLLANGRAGPAYYETSEAAETDAKTVYNFARAFLKVKVEEEQKIKHAREELEAQLRNIE